MAWMSDEVPPAYLVALSGSARRNTMAELEMMSVRDCRGNGGQGRTG
jgi:hypothetical protein